MINLAIYKFRAIIVCISRHRYKMNEKSLKCTGRFSIQENLLNNSPKFNIETLHL